MSTLTTALINSKDGSTDLTVSTGNTSGPSVIVSAGTNITLKANSSFTAAVVNASGMTVSVPLTTAKALNMAKGASVASAATTDIWTPGDGNLIHITGTTGITSFGTAPQAGTRRYLVFDGITVLTASANLVISGVASGSTYTTAIGDSAIVMADTTTVMLVNITRANGSSVLGPGPHVSIEDQKTSGTAPQTLTVSTWNTRDLNTIVFDPLSLVTVLSNQFTLKAGTYVIKFSATAGSNGSGTLSKAKLYSITASADVAFGSSETNNSYNTSRSYGTARVTIAVATTYEIRHNVSQTITGGFAASLGTEVYTQVEITKVG